MNKLLRAAMLLAVMVCTSAAMADQEKKYSEISAEIRQKVWNENRPEFQQYKCPDKYNGKSAVILAARTDINLSAKGYMRFNWSLNLEKVKKLTKTVTNHALIKIYDQAAQKRFSEFEIGTMEKGHTWTGLKETSVMVLGVRVIKPDGTVSEVDADDFVTQSEGKGGKDKTQKLAVPGLQVGDIIEYFVYEEEMVKNRNVPSSSIYYLKDYPVIDYKVHCVIDKDYTTQYRTLNGAPDFTISENEDGDNVLDAAVSNVDDVAPDIWYNSMAQSPMTLMYFYDKSVSYSQLKSIKKRGIQANPDYNSIIGDDRAYLFSDYWYIVYNQWKKWNGVDLDAVKNMADKSAAVKLLANSVYEYGLSKGFVDGTLNPYDYISFLRFVLAKQKLPFEAFISTTTNHEPVDQLANSGNTAWLIRTDDGAFISCPAYNSMIIGTLPNFLQGRKAANVQEYKDVKKGERYPLIELPTSACTENQMFTALNITIDGTDAVISRKQTMTGTMKERASSLITIKQLHDGYEKLLGYSQHYIDKLSKKEREGRQQIEEKEVKDQQEYFRYETEGYHKRAAKVITKCEVTNTGLQPDQPALQYAVDYTMDGIVKRAGNNLMLSVGLLFSDQRAIEGRERERKADINRGVPSQYVTEITVTLPSGYNVAKESLAKLTRNVTNNCGSFTAKASQTGNTLAISVQTCFTKSDYKVSEWSQLLEIADAAKAFNAAQVVLKK